MTEIHKAGLHPFVCVSAAGRRSGTRLPTTLFFWNMCLRNRGQRWSYKQRARGASAVNLHSHVFPLALRGFFQSSYSRKDWRQASERSGASPRGGLRKISHSSCARRPFLMKLSESNKERRAGLLRRLRFCFQKAHNAFAWRNSNVPKNKTKKNCRLPSLELTYVLRSFKQPKILQFYNPKVWTVFSIIRPERRWR